jgi:hypothetical protein
MKTLTLLTLLIAVGCILATGCVAQTKKDPVNVTVTPAPTTTFSPFVNTTKVPGTYAPNATTVTNVTNTTAKPKLKGPLRVSIGSYSADQPLPVIIDNQTVGVVTRGAPIDLMVDEGNHTIQVCVGVICPEKYIDIGFAKRSYLDFEEILKLKAEYSKPTVLILKSFKNGQGVSVDLEFINPTLNAASMSAEVSCGYTYIDSRTSIRLGDSARVKATEWVEAGTRVTRTVDLSFGYGSSYQYDPPVLGEVTWK